MSYRALLALTVTIAVAVPAGAYVEVPHSLGQVVKESTTIVLMEVARVEKTKNLIIFKKLQDLKGKHAQEQIKHNIGKRGFHPRESQAIMSWAEEGKKAIFFHNGGASETCIGTYWYQCYPEGEWWGMSHGEPFLLRTYYGDVDRLAAAVTAIQQGQEVVITCLADGNKNQLHERKGKLQRMRASLKRANYDAKRDFVAFGGDGDEEPIPEFKAITLLAESSPGWKYTPARSVTSSNNWRLPVFSDGSWRIGKAPIGYGEEEIAKRGGTTIAEKGQAFVFRRVVEVSADLLAAKGVMFRVAVASDNSATVFLNGEQVDEDSEADHEFSYWNRELELAPKHFRPGANTFAVLVKNTEGSSDLYFDMEVAAQIPLPPKKPVRTAAASTGAPTTAATVAPEEPERPGVLSVDAARRSVTIEGVVAPRKLPNLNEVYPIEVVATYPAPRGQKAHETVVAFTGVRPSSVQKALTQLGLKPGKPARGEGAKAEGPELAIYVETEVGGTMRRIPVEQLLVDKRTGKPLPALTWHFTGSALKQPDPEKDVKLPGADLTGTLISLFPVTDDTVIQSSLTMKDEGSLKLEIAANALPKEGTPVKLVIVAR